MNVCDHSRRLSHFVQARPTLCKKNFPRCCERLYGKEKSPDRSREIPAICRVRCPPFCPKNSALPFSKTPPPLFRHPCRSGAGRLTVHGPSPPTSAAQRTAFPASACCVPCPPALKSPCACGPPQALAKADSGHRRSSANQKRRELSERMCMDYPTPSPARGCCFSATPPLLFGSLLSLIACPPCRCSPTCSPPDCLFALSPRLIFSRPPRFARPLRSKARRVHRKHTAHPAAPCKCCLFS